MGQMPNRKFAEEIISNMKGSTLTNDGHGNRNGGLSFAPWMANQSFESNLLSKTQEIASTHMNTTLQNIKSNALLQRSEPDVSPYLKDQSVKDKVSKALKRKNVTQAMSPNADT
jgi:hypothetical protein